nr:hypothetical protein BHE74_00017168 [Ipomoea batatas]
MSRESMEEDPSSKLVAYDMFSSGRIDVWLQIGVESAEMEAEELRRRRNLLLESKDVRNAAINGILKPGLSFIGDGNGGLGAVPNGEMREKLRSITGTKNLMDGCKMGSSLFMAEIGGKNTALNAFSSQEFAGTTRGATCRPTHP